MIWLFDTYCTRYKRALAGYSEGNKMTTFWYDAAKHVSRVFMIKEVEDDYVLGYKCKGLSFQSIEIEIIYWYSELYKVDTGRCINHHAYYFSEFISKSSNLICSGKRKFRPSPQHCALFYS